MPLGSASALKMIQDTYNNRRKNDMSELKRFLSVALCLSVLISCACALSGCGNNKFKIEYTDVVQENGKISASPYSAEYGNDGKLTVVVAVHNGTEYTKILTAVNITSLKNKKGFDIVEANRFTIDDKKYLEPNTISLYECVFEKEQVKANVKLETLESEITLEYKGCVKTEDVPKESDKECYTANIMEGEFNSTGGFEGKICMRNNYKTAKTPYGISFDIYDNLGRKVNTETIHKLNNDLEIAPNKMVTLNIDLTADYVNQEIAQKCDFDMLYIKNFKVYKEQ